MWRNGINWLVRGRLRPALGLSLLVAGVFGPALGFDFVRWDDPVNVTHNPLITEPWSVDLLARLVNGDTALRFKPLPWLLYRGVHAVFGFEPAAWHGLSLILHLAAVLMFHAVLRAILEHLYPAVAGDRRDWLAWLGAALWAVHPAHVEAACWVTATPYPLLALLLLGSFWFYVRAMDSARIERSRANLGWAWCLALAGYATYPVGATYGLWLVAADVWIFRRAPRREDGWRGMRSWLTRHALFLLPAVLGVWVTMRSSSSTPWLYPAPPTLAEMDVFARLKMGAAMLGSVWKNLLWPYGLTPNNPILPSWKTDGPVILVMGALSLTVITTVWLVRHRWPRVAGAVLGSTALALPVLGFGQWPHWATADRHVYLPHLVLTGALVACVASRMGGVGGKRWMLPLLLGAVGGLALLGRAQVMIWQNTDTLFRYIEAQPAFAWNSAQQAYIYQLWAAHAQEEGRTQDAQERSRLARQAFQAGSFVAAERGAWIEAVELSRLQEQTFGLPPVLRRERARWLLKSGRFQEAWHDLVQCLREMPDDPETRHLLDEVHQQKPPG